MAGPLFAPRLSEPAQRLERIKSVLSQFGIDADKLDEALRVPFMNVGTPMEEVRTFFVPSDLEDKSQVAAAIAGEVIGGRTVNANNCRGKGLSAFCESDEDMMRLLGGIFSALSRFEAEQSISADTQRWLQNTELGLPSTILSGMAKIEQSRWMDENFDNFIRAAVFQAWAKERGVEQPVIDEAGRALYGGLWDYASATGLYLERRDESTWYLKGGEGTVAVREALKGMPYATSESFLGAVPVREEAGAVLAEELGPIEQFRAFYARTMDREGNSRLFSRPVRHILSVEGRDGWLRLYLNKYSDITKISDRREIRDGIQEALAFYVWATYEQGWDSERVREMGSANFAYWDFAERIGVNLKARGSQFILPTSNLEDVRVAFGRIEGAGERLALPTMAPAAVETGTMVATAETVPELASLAERIGVSVAFLKRAAALINSGERVRVAFDAATEEGTYREVRMASGEIGLFYGGGPGEHDNVGLLRAVQDARRMA